MLTTEEATKAKERALVQGIKVWELEPGVRYAVLSCSREGVAYEIKVENTGTSPAPVHRPGIVAVVSTLGQS